MTPWRLRQVFWYLVVGGTTAAGYFIVATVLHRQWGLGLTAASLVAILSMHPFSYLGHRYLTFQYPGPWARSLWRFAAVATLSTVVAVVLPLAQGLIGMGATMALTVNCVAIPAITFLAYRLWVFRFSPVARTFETPRLRPKN